MTETFSQVKAVFEALSKWDTDLFFAIRNVAGRWLNPKTPQIVKAILAYETQGVQFVSAIMLRELLGTDRTTDAMLERLHNLGDRRVVTLIRDPVMSGRLKQHAPLRYTLNAEFRDKLPTQLKQALRGFSPVQAMPLERKVIVGEEPLEDANERAKKEAI